MATTNDVTRWAWVSMLDDCERRSDDDAPYSFLDPEKPRHAGRDFLHVRRPSIITTTQAALTMAFISSLAHVDRTAMRLIASQRCQITPENRSTASTRLGRIPTHGHVHMLLARLSSSIVSEGGRDDTNNKQFELCL